MVSRRLQVVVSLGNIGLARASPWGVSAPDLAVGREVGVHIGFRAMPARARHGVDDWVQDAAG